jgi:hypothetical protein
MADQVAADQVVADQVVADQVVGINNDTKYFCHYRSTIEYNWLIG